MSLPKQSDFKDGARLLATALKEKFGVDVKHSQALDLLSRAFGAKNWHVAKQQSEATPKHADEPNPDSLDQGLESVDDKSDDEILYRALVILAGTRKIGGINILLESDGNRTTGRNADRDVNISVAFVITEKQRDQLEILLGKRTQLIDLLGKQLAANFELPEIFISYDPDEPDDFRWRNPSFSVAMEKGFFIADFGIQLTRDAEMTDLADLLGNINTVPVNPFFYTWPGGQKTIINP